MRTPTAALAAAVALIPLIVISSASAQDATIERSGEVTTYHDPQVSTSGTQKVSGILQQVVRDVKDPSSGAVRGVTSYVIRSDSGYTSISFDRDLPDGLTGSRITANVAKTTPRPVAKATLRPAQRSIGKAEASAGLAKKAKLFYVTNSGSFPAELASKIKRSADYWVTESGGAISSFTLDGPTRLTIKDDPRTRVDESSRSFVCSMSPEAADYMWSAAMDATEGQNIDHQVVMLSGDKACASETYALGYGSLGYEGLESPGTTLTLAGQSAEPTQVHEFGHNFGLHHADGRPCAACTSFEYDNFYSPMGYTWGTSSAALDARYRSFLGILKSTETVTPTLGDSDKETVTKHVLSPRGGTSGLRSVKVKDAIAGTTFWLEYRDGSGRDTGSLYADTDDKGLTINVQRSYEGQGEFASMELLNRNTDEATTGSWPVGSRYISRSKGVRVRVASISDGQMSIYVAQVHRAFKKAPNPKISGTPAVGQVLTSARGTWSPTPKSTTYRWQQRRPGRTYADISGATSSKYRVAGAYRGRDVRSVVTSRARGYQATTRVSAPVRIR